MEFINRFNNGFIQSIVKSIFYAVTDDIRRDTRKAHLDRSYMNSYPSRIWDLINRNLFYSLGNNDDIIIRSTSRGPWKLAAIFDKKTEMLLTIMREERFFSVIKDKNNSHHYISHLAQMFNVDLEKFQQTIFEQESDEDEVKKTISRICNDLFISSDMIKHHAIVLFSAQNEMLNSIRCVMINRNFEECESISWNDFIPVSESIVVEQINNSVVHNTNTPNRGLKLTNKAKEKQGLNSNISYKPDKSLDSEKSNN